jgi:hypothetical protein
MKQHNVFWVFWAIFIAVVLFWGTVGYGLFRLAEYLLW